MNNNYKMVVYCVSTTDGIQWNVEFPEVKGCGGAGDTPEEAIADAKVNLAAHLEFLKEVGMAVPQAQDESVKENYSGKLSLRLAKSLHREISELAEKDNVSINSIINIAIAKYVEKESNKYNTQCQQHTINKAVENDFGYAQDIKEAIIPYWLGDTQSQIIKVGG